MAIFISDKIDFNPKVTIKRNTEGHYIILKRVVQQEKNIAIVNTYTVNIGAHKYIKNILEDFRKGIHSNTLIVGDFNTPFPTMDKFSTQKLNKDIAALNDTLDQMDLINIRKTFCPKEVKYTFFLNAYGSFSKIDHMVGHKTSLNKFKKFKIISSIFSDHNYLKLETNTKEGARW